MNKTLRHCKNKLMPPCKNAVDERMSAAQSLGMRTFAKRLDDLIKEQMAQGVDEAELCREIGVHKRLIGQWRRRGTISKDEKKFWLLCRRLGTHPNYLLGWSEHRAPKEPPMMAAELDAELKAIKRELAKGRR